MNEDYMHIYNLIILVHRLFHYYCINIFIFTVYTQCSLYIIVYINVINTYETTLIPFISRDSLVLLNFASINSMQMMMW